MKLAQSMAGALLWLTTRTRPDIAMTVSSACRLATKNPCKSVEISKAVMQYVLKVQGGLHYPQGVPKETWGKRGQLHIERHDRLLEVFADIAYGHWQSPSKPSRPGSILCWSSDQLGVVAAAH